MRELIEIVHNANQHLLAERLRQNQHEEYQAIKLQYARLMGQLVEYCKTELLAAPKLTTAFICGLHRLLYPADYICSAQDADGRTVPMHPGEYKLLRQAADNPSTPGSFTVFMPPEQVSEAMELIVETLEQQVKITQEADKKRDAIVVFILGYLQIHPFFDGNGRMACMLTDLLLLREGLQVINFSPIYRKDKAGMVRVLDEVRETRRLERLYEYIEGQHSEIDKGEPQHGN